MVQISIDEQKLDGYRTFDGFVEVKLPPMDANLTPFERESRRLTLINRILAEQRHIAWDHEFERHEGKNEFWHGAALIETNDGRFFLDSNAHLLNSPAIRNCAEALGATDAFQHRGYGTRIKRLYFMGGRADISHDLPLLPDEEGKRYTPCGSCLDVINKLSDDKTQITLFPANSGSWEILPYEPGKSMDQLAREQVYDTTVKELLPHLSVHRADAQGKIKETLRAAWDYIRDAEKWQALSRAEELHLLDKELPNLPAKEAMREINALMMQRMKKMYHDSEGEVTTGSVVVIRSDDGRYYIGTARSNPRTSDLHPAMDHAIQNMLDGDMLQHATDIFLMSCDFERFPNLFAKWKENPAQPVTVPMPDGDARERAKKVTSADAVPDMQGTVLSAKSANFHILLPNNVKDFDPDIHKVDFTLRDLLPHAYVNPRSLRANGNGGGARTH